MGEDEVVGRISESVDFAPGDGVASTASLAGEKKGEAGRGIGEMERPCCLARAASARAQIVCVTLSKPVGEPGN